MVDLARKNLLHDRLRFFITVSGVAFAVTLVLVQVGLFSGLLDNASDTIDHLDADLWVTSRNVPNIDFAKTFPQTYLERVRSIPGVRRADNLIVTYYNVSLPSGASETTVAYALEDFTRWNLPWHVTAGNLSDLRRGRYFFIDESAKRRFGQFEVGDYREILNNRLKIIGKSRDALSFTTTPITFMSYETAQALSPATLDGNTCFIIVKLAPGAKLEDVRAEIRRRLPRNDVYTRDEWSRRSRAYWMQSTGIGINMYTTVLLGCLVGLVVVAQTLYTSTMEHIKEFGTLKAIGGGNADIYKILGEQALIAAVAGYVLGGAMTLAVKPLMYDIGLKLIISPAFAGIVFAGTVVMCLAASMISFRKVASIDPALVFRS